MNGRSRRISRIGSILIVLATLIFMAGPLSRVEAATVRYSINETFNTAAWQTSPNTADAGWYFTPTTSFTLGRIEFRFNAGNGVAVTVELWSNRPTLGGTLLASGVFTPAGGNVWEGANLSPQVTLTGGTQYFFGIKNLYQTPTTNAGAAIGPTLYYSYPEDNYLNDAGALSANYKPIVRFVETLARFTINDVTVTEGNAGTTIATFTVTRSGDTESAVSVDWALDDNSATVADNDYVDANGTAFFAATQTTAVIGVTINGDVNVEGDETYFVTLSNPSAGAQIDDASGLGTITNDDANTPPTITSPAPPDGTEGVAYSHNYTATGTAPITFSVTAGALPPGLTLTAGGLLSGTPTTAGNYTGTVTATNGTAPDATQDFDITISAAPVAPTITSPAPGDGTVGVAYTHNYTATGTSPITWSVTAGALPTGLTLDPNTGVLNGTPTTAGNYTGTVTATNGVAPDATQNFNITISAAPVAPTITSPVPPDGTVGAGYSHNYTATGTAPITWSVTAGTLPTGLTLDPNTGVLNGTPTAAGNFTGTVTATNGTAPDDTQNFNITINTGSVAPTITSPAPANGTLGVAYTHNYTATGTLPITWSVTVGTLPTGLTLDPNTGVLSGTPTATGNFTGTVTATNGTAPDDTQNFNITIGTTPVPPAPTTPVVVVLPEPPPAPSCTDVAFESNGVMRTHFTNDADRPDAHCRLLVENGHYLSWFGGPLTQSANIGNQTVLDLGVLQAVDVFSPNGATGYQGDVVICLKGTGYMIYLGTNQSPRVPQLWSSWTTDAFPGYTCTTLYAPGTVVLVSQRP